MTPIPAPAFFPRYSTRPGSVQGAAAFLLASVFFLPMTPAAFAGAPAAAPLSTGASAGTVATASPGEEPQVVELMYYTTDANGRSVGMPGPDDDLVQIIRHRNGKLWPGQKVDFDVTGGSRLLSLVKGIPPFVRHLTVYSDEHGVARVYLQPLP